VGFFAAAPVVSLAIGAFAFFLFRLRSTAIFRSAGNYSLRREGWLLQVEQPIHRDKGLVHPLAA
jgi:hypothetical protein